MSVRSVSVVRSVVEAAHIAPRLFIMYYNSLWARKTETQTHEQQSEVQKRFCALYSVSGSGGNASVRAARVAN